MHSASYGRERHKYKKDGVRWRWEKKRGTSDRNTWGLVGSRCGIWCTINATHESESFAFLTIERIARAGGMTIDALSEWGGGMQGIVLSVSWLINWCDWLLLIAGWRSWRIGARGSAVGSSTRDCHLFGGRPARKPENEMDPEMWQRRGNI